MKKECMGAAIAAAMAIAFGTAEAQAFNISADAVVTSSDGINYPAPYQPGQMIWLSLNVSHYDLLSTAGGVNVVSFLPDDPFGYAATPLRFYTFSYSPTSFSIDFGVGVDGGLIGGDGSSSFAISAGGPSSRDADGVLHYTSGVTGFGRTESYGNGLINPDADASVTVGFTSFTFDPSGLPSVEVVPLPSTAPLFALALWGLVFVGLARRKRVGACPA